MSRTATSRLKGLLRPLYYRLRPSARPKQKPPKWIDVVMALDGMTARRELKMLYRLARQTSEGCIVEVGSYRGRSTAALSYGSRAGHGVQVFAIEPHAKFRGVLGGKFGPRDRKAFFRAMLRTGGWRNVSLVNLTSDILTSGWRAPVGLLWIDGDHSYEGVSRDFQCWEPHLLEDACVVFDDALNERAGVRRFVSELEAQGWRATQRVGKTVALVRENVDAPVGEAVVAR